MLQPRPAMLHTSATSASLLLPLEALLTAVIARLLYSETMDRRVWLAVLAPLATA